MRSASIEIAIEVLVILSIYSDAGITNLIAITCVITLVYLCVARLDIVEKEHHRNEEESTNEIKSTPPSTGHFDVLCQYIGKWLGELQGMCIRGICNLLWWIITCTQ